MINGRKIIKKLIKQLGAIITLCILIGTLVLAVACGDKSYGTLKIADVENLVTGETRPIEAVFSDESWQGEITYSFKSDAIEISNGTVTALKGGRTVTVTATTEHHTARFRVTTAEGSADRGTLSFADIEAEVEKPVTLKPVFTPVSSYVPVTYSFEGKDILIENGKLYALAEGKEITVTANTAFHQTSFTVTTKRPAKLVREITAWIGYPASDLPNGYFRQGEEVAYSGGNVSVATFDQTERTVTAVAAGECTITASTEGYSEEYHITVKAVDKTDKKWTVSGADSLYAQELANRWKTDGTPDTTLFIGDSFFDVRSYWTDFYEDDFAGKDAICAGIGGTTTYDWETFTQSFLKSTSPKNIVMDMGTNNFYDDHDSAEEGLENLQRMFTLIHGTLPDAKIYYFAITQRVRTDYRSQVSQTNTAMKEWCMGRDWIEFLDTESQIKPSMLRADGVHPKLETYALYVDALTAAGAEIKTK